MTAISATQQFKAIAYLRWRLFVNAFRRKGGKGELIASIIVYPVAIIVLAGIVFGSFAAAWAAARHGKLELLAGIFWAAFLLQTLVSVNVSPPNLAFDPAALIRFPLSFPRYLVVRLFLGLLAASNVVSTCALLAAATGVTLVYPGIFVYTYAAALALALTNMLFTRMVFAWVDRWLSTRRARELFTAFIIVASIGFQYVNLTINGGGHSGHADVQRQAKIAAFLRIYKAAAPVLHHLPPGLAADAVVAASKAHPATSISLLLAVLLFAAAFLAVFAWRMQREYRGENFSEAAGQARPDPNAPRTDHSTKILLESIPAKPLAGAYKLQTDDSPASGAPTLTQALPNQPLNTRTSSFLPPVLLPLLHKEYTYICRNAAQFFSLLAPLAMVFLFATRMGRFGQGFLFPAAAAYSSLGISALAYNVLGTDANGIQFYFLSPVRFHLIFLAKNLFGFGIAALQFVLIYVVLCFISGPPSMLSTLSVLAWMVFATLVNATVGNIRSITAPKKMDPAKVTRRQASQLSALLGVGITLAMIGVGALTLLAASAAGLRWLPLPVFVILAIGAFVLYYAGLNRVDAMAVSHRDTLIEELAKAE